MISIIVARASICIVGRNKRPHFGWENVLRAAFQIVVTFGYGVAKVFQFYLNTVHCKFSLCLLGAEARLARKPEFEYGMLLKF